MVHAHHQVSLYQSSLWYVKKNKMLKVMWQANTLTRNDCPAVMR